MHDHPDPRAKLDWLAFQYLANELTSQRRQEFEQRLEHDQLAREAVARTIELTQLVLDAEAVQPKVAVTNSTASTSTWPWWFAGAAVCLITCAILAAAYRQPPRSLGRPPAATIDQFVVSPELAYAWATTREQFGEGTRSEEDPLLDALAEHETPTNADSASSSNRFQAPAWMLAGVAATMAGEFEE